MFQEIIHHLYSYNDYEYHGINSFLKEKFKDMDLSEIKSTLVKLVIANRILIENNTHLKLNLTSRINENDYKNTFRDLDNLKINAKLTLEEKERLQLQNNGSMEEISLMNIVLTQLNTKEVSGCHYLDELVVATNIDKNTIEVICQKIDKLKDCSYHPQCICITKEGKYRAEHGGYKDGKITQPLTIQNQYIHKNYGIANQVAEDSAQNIKQNITNNVTPITPKKRSLLELLSWIAGIIGGLLLIYEFIIKHFLT